MARAVPAKLKSTELARLAHRAAQLEKLKPVVTYWCYYWIVNQILSKGLHNGDAECFTYTTSLMDDLEQMKAENADNDAITDDVAGQAYVEQFALEVFERADAVVRADKVTGQTADTFQAAATFLELLQIWGPLDPEIASKIKYAKYHALRIAKAIRAGEDPNLSNPASNSPLDPAAQQIIDELNANPNAGSAMESRDSNASRQPMVEDADEMDAGYPLHSPAGGLPNISPINWKPEDASQGPTATSAEQTRPPASLDAEYRPAGDGQDTAQSGPGQRDHGYFPNSSFPSSEPNPLNLPTAPPDEPMRPFVLPSAPGAEHASSDPGVGAPPTASGFPGLGSQANAGPDSSFQPQSGPLQPPIDHATYSHPFPPTPSAAPDHYYRAPTGPTLPTAPAPQARIPDAEPTYRTDEEAIAKATKHARWAISALNFEDVATAAKEFRAALESLT